MAPHLIVPCATCGFENVFRQPYRYHAGFSDMAFLYNEAGNCTLVWGVYDPVYERLLAGDDAWRPSRAHQEQLEALLPLSPCGDRWCFAAPARCSACSAVIAKPMASGEIYYLEYSGSIMLGCVGAPSGLEYILTSSPDP